MTRKSTITIALVLLLVVCIAGSFASDALKVRVKVPLANVRQSPDMAAAVLAQIAQGTVLDVLDKTGDWYRVTLPAGGAGFIFATVVDEIAGTSAPAAPAAKTPPAAAPPVNRPAPPARLPQGAPEPSIPAAVPSSRFVITLGYLAGGASESSTLDFTSPAYQETASYGLAYNFAKGGAIDFSVGYLIGPSWGIKLGGSMISRGVTETTEFAIPHPLWINTPRAGSLEGSGMSLKETHLFLNLFFTLRFGALAVDLYGGPCYVLSTATIVSALSYSDSAYPYATVTASQSATALKGNAFGFDGGASLSFNFGSSFGVYVDARYSSAKATYSPGGDIPDLSVALGGFRFGGGLKVSF
jgi:hypothetical protein